MTNAQIAQTLDRMMVEFLKTTSPGIVAASPSPKGYGSDLSKWPTTPASGAHWRNGEVLRKQALAALAPVPPSPPANTVAQSIASGSSISGTEVWTATPTGSPTDVLFTVDGGQPWTESSAPYQYNGDPGGQLDTAKLSDGAHVFQVVAHYPDGTVASSPVTATVANGSTPPTPPSPGSGPSGIAIPASDPAGWTRLLTEDFATDVPLGSWPQSAGGGLTHPPGYSTLGAYPYPWVNPAGGGLYDPSRVLSIHNSLLDTYIHSAADGQLTGTVQTLVPPGQSKLRVQCCSLFPVVANLHISFLLWPDDNLWPKNGEVDFPEADCVNGGSFQCFVHLENAIDPNHPGWQTSHDFKPAVLCDGRYHVYTIEWVSGNHVTVQRDDTPPWTTMNSPTNQIPNTPMHFEHQTDANGASSGRIIGSGHVLTDWITVCA